MRHTTQSSIHIFHYNRNFDLNDNNENIEFVDINLRFYGLCLPLLANVFITYTKK